MLLPLEGRVVVHDVNFITCGTQKRIIDVNMFRKEEIIRKCFGSVPRNEDVVQWIVSPQVLPCFGETPLMTSMPVLLWQESLDSGTVLRKTRRQNGGQLCSRLSVRALESQIVAKDLGIRADEILVTNKKLDVIQPTVPASSDEPLAPFVEYGPLMKNQNLIFPCHNGANDITISSCL